MDFKRKAYDELLAWKKKTNHKPIIVEGLRQVGKSYIVSKFAKENYENVVLLDFRHDPEIRLSFKGTLEIDQIITSIQTRLPNNKIIPHKTCFIFEEIGDCDDARASLKSFAIDGRYDVIATGSLLGVDNYRKKHKAPIPTGYEEFLEMSSMDFEEFLWAMNTPQAAIDMLKNGLASLEELPIAIDSYFKEMIKRYMVLGGMPDVIKTFLETNLNYIEARNVQNRLIHDYRADFGRFINDKGKEEIDYQLQSQLNQIFDAIPSQLSRESEVSKFKLSEVSKSARYYQYANAFDWLEKAGLILRTFNLKAIERPLESNKEKNSFKIFISDPGLLMSLFPIATLQDFLNDKLDSRKGSLYENLLATIIHKSGFPLMYFGNYEKHLEIDFLIEGKDGIILLEEKSTNGKMAASRQVMEGKTPYKATQCVKINSNGIGKGSFYISIPQYMSPFFLQNERKTLEDGLQAKPIALEM